MALICFKKIQCPVVSNISHCLLKQHSYQSDKHIIDDDVSCEKTLHSDFNFESVY